MNLVICHELGHYVFEELGLERRLTAVINEALKNLELYRMMTEPDLSWCRERLKYWSEEIYCDRFAIGLIGPAYSFAYIELWDVVGTSHVDDESELVEFWDTHPSDACRFREHFDQLRKGDWWTMLTENSTTSYVGLIEKLASIDESQYIFELRRSREMTLLCSPKMTHRTRRFEYPILAVAPGASRVRPAVSR